MCVIWKGLLVVINSPENYQQPTCRSGLFLTGHPDSSAVHASPPPVSLSFLAPTFGPPQSPLQGLDLLPAPCHLFQKTVLHQPGDLIHGGLEDRFHDTRKLGLKRYYSPSHYTNNVWWRWPVFIFSNLHFKRRQICSLFTCSYRAQLTSVSLH